MAEFSVVITVEGMDALVKKLGVTAAQEALHSPLEVIQKLIADKLKEYPPVPPNSTYVRTGNLGTGWQTPGFGGMIANVTNLVEYAPFVQGDPILGNPHQTEQHADTGWPTDVQVIEEVIPEATELFTAAIQAELDS